MSPMNKLGQTSSTWLPNLFPPYKTFTKSFTDGVAGETALLSCRLFILDCMNLCLHKMLLQIYPFVWFLLSTFVLKLCWGFTTTMLVLTRTGVPGLKLNQSVTYNPNPNPLNTSKYLLYSCCGILWHLNTQNLIYCIITIAILQN